MHSGHTWWTITQNTQFFKLSKKPILKSQRSYRNLKDINCKWKREKLLHNIIWEVLIEIQNTIFIKMAKACLPTLKAGKDVHQQNSLKMFIYFGQFLTTKCSAYYTIQQLFIHPKCWKFIFTKTLQVYSTATTDAT